MIYNKNTLWKSRIIHSYIHIETLPEVVCTHLLLEEESEDLESISYLKNILTLILHFPSSRMTYFYSHSPYVIDANNVYV